jgi:hypothetical protein
MKESNSLHLEDQPRGVAGGGMDYSAPETPGDDGLDYWDSNLFDAFSSVTLHYDGDS